MKSGCMYQDITLDPQRLAIYLAMTKSIEEEKQMISELQKHGIKGAATMATGVNMDISGKVLNGVIGACLNAGIVEKKRSHLHPLVHAILEALGTSNVQPGIQQNCRLKIAIVRDDEAVAICIYGDIAIHELTTHKTIGWGYQLLGN